MKTLWRVYLIILVLPVGSFLFFYFSMASSFPVLVGQNKFFLLIMGFFAALAGLVYGDFMSKKTFAKASQTAHRKIKVRIGIWAYVYRWLSLALPMFYSLIAFLYTHDVILLGLASGQLGALIMSRPQLKVWVRELGG